jgi:hypothetical protein
MNLRSESRPRGLKAMPLAVIRTGLGLLLGCMLAAMPIPFIPNSFQQALGQEGPMCQTSRPVGGLRCRHWQCTRQGRCLQQIGWKPSPLPNKSYTPGQQEYENVAVYDWTTGCLQWTCREANISRDCSPGFIRINARCVPAGSQQVGGCHPGFSRIGARCVPDARRVFIPDVPRRFNPPPPRR